MHHRRAEARVIGIVNDAASEAIRRCYSDIGEDVIKLLDECDAIESGASSAVGHHIRRHTLEFRCESIIACKCADLPMIS